MLFQELQDIMQPWNRVSAYEVFRIEGQEKTVQKLNTFCDNNIQMPKCVAYLQSKTNAEIELLQSLLKQRLMI